MKSRADDSGDFVVFLELLHEVGWQQARLVIWPVARLQRHKM